MPLFIRRLLGLFILGNLLFIIWLGIAALPLWQITKVSVIGNDYIPTGKIITAAGIPPGQSLLLVSAPTICSNIQKLPWVEKARVQRKLPNTLILVITPKKALYRLRSTSSIWIIDQHGTLLNRDGVIPTKVPVDVSGLDQISQAPDFVNGANPTIQGVLAIVSENITLQYASQEITVITEHGLIIKIGVPTQLKEKLFALNELWKVLSNQRTNIAYIDIRAYRTPAVRFK